MKKRIGLVPGARLFDTDDFYHDNYVFVDLYSRRITECGGVPLGILGVEGAGIEEAMEACDALMICGGGRIYPFHFQAVEHAVNTGKKLLGICLGMQTIHSFFVVKEEAKRRGYTGSLTDLYAQMKKERYMFTEPVEHHWDVNIRRGLIEETKHEVTLRPGSLIFDLLQADSVMGSTMHHYRITEPAECLTVSGTAKDGTIEALEYGKNILGVQFHPEVDRKTDALFRFLTEA